MQSAAISTSRWRAQGLRWIASLATRWADTLDQRARERDAREYEMFVRDTERVRNRIANLRTRIALDAAIGPLPFDRDERGGRW